MGILCLLTSGCSTVGYYGQAMSGQVEIWRKQVPIDSVESSGDADRELRRKLDLVKEMTMFAESRLGLPANGDYTRYADLGREHVVWVVFAAPALSLEPKTFWYPVVGSLHYRGFFKESAAEAFAGQLRSKGFDVYVGGVDAYSTLGWFSDPVLNTFMHYDDIDLAELIFHELTHQRVFVPGATAFNEAMATAVSEEGTRRWLASRGDEQGVNEYAERLERQAVVFQMIESVRTALGELYASPLADTEKLERKAGLIVALQNQLRPLSEHWGEATREAWLENPPTNALFNATAAYYAMVPCFSRLIEDLDGDLDRFFLAVSELDPDAIQAGACE
ncbi:MAG: aminopeptidase [Opitutaceae bacterium]